MHVDDDDDVFMSLHNSFTILRNGTGCRTSAMAVPLFLTSGPARGEAMHHGCATSPVCFMPKQQYFSYIMAVI